MTLITGQIYRFSVKFLSIELGGIKCSLSEWCRMSVLKNVITFQHPDVALQPWQACSNSLPFIQKLKERMLQVVYLDEDKNVNARILGL